MDSEGNFKWATKLGGDWSDFGSSIALSTKGEVYVAGYSYNFAIRYGINLPRIPDPSLGSSDLLIAKYTSTEALLWAKKDGGIYEDFAGGLVVSNNGNIYIAGSFDTTTTLTGDTLTAPVNPRSRYNKDIFFVRYRE